MAKVLIVDDVAANRELLATLVRHRGHEVLEAIDGAAALELVRTEHPDLVISDILMPTMDGFEFVQQLRSDPAIAATPVVFYTAHYRGREAQNLARACGVAHVLTKPCEPAEILKTLDAALAHAPAPAPAAAATEGFDREHLRLMTDKLAEKVESLQATNQRLAALTEAMLHMASDREPEVLLEGVCREARNLVVGRRAVLCVRNKDNSSHLVCATSGVEAELESVLRPERIDAGAIGAVFATGKAWRAAGAPLAGLPSRYPAVHSILVAPIVSLSATYGWIAVLDKVGMPAFDAEDERVLVGLAAQLGRVYENGSLYRRLAHHAEKLRESELRFRQLAENIHEVFYLVTADFSRILYVSPGYETMWGRPCEELYADPHAWLNAIHPEDRARVQVSAEGYDLRYRIRRPDGELRWIHDRAFPIPDDSGVVYRVAGIAEDVTVPVQMEKQLRERGDRLRHAQKLAQLAHVVTDSYGGFVSWSETLPPMIATVDGAMPRSTRMWVELVHPDDRELFRNTAIEAGKTGVPTHVEYRLRRRDGVLIHLRQAIEPIKDGAPLGLMSWFSTLQDISEQKRAEEERRESDRRFIEMMGKIRLISIMLDRAARITYCNDYLLELTGWQREEVIGGNWFETFIPGDNTTLRETFEALLSDTPPTWHVENEILTRSGERRMVRWNNSVLRSAAGEVIGVASIGEDITDRQRAEAEVHRLNADLERRVLARTAELEAANKELETYDYSISHDLRGPLNRIEGFSAALLEDHAAQLDPAGQEHLRRIARAAQTLTRMVSDMLRLSTWSRVELNRGPVDVSSLALGILHALAAGEPGRKVKWAVEPGLECRADAGLLRVVLENLIGNAWKYSSKRKVAVVEVGSITQDGERAFWVSDNGAGFDPLEARDLFKPFRRLASSAAFPGTGVGLATVLRIVRRHGGRIWAEGRPGEGATFYFTLEPEG